MEKFKVLHYLLLQKGIYLGPSGYEVGFVSSAHSQEALQITADAMIESLDVVFSLS